MPDSVGRVKRARTRRADPCPRTRLTRPPSPRQHHVYSGATPRTPVDRAPSFIQTTSSRERRRGPRSRNRAEGERVPIVGRRARRSSRAGVRCVRAERPASVERSSQQGSRASCRLLLRFVRLSSERVRQAVRQDCSSAEKQEFPPALLVVVPSERLGGTAADARIRGTTSAGFRKAIRLCTARPSLIGLMAGATFLARAVPAHLRPTRDSAL